MVLGREPSEHECEANAGNFARNYKETWKIATGLPKNLKTKKHFEDLELGGDLQARGILVSIRKIRRAGRTDREESQIHLESSGTVRVSNTCELNFNTRLCFQLICHVFLSVYSS